MRGWEARLAAIRHQAALNCGLTHYPADLIRKHEDTAWRKADRILWARHLAEYDKGKDTR